jgi:hypothetical protein
MQSSKFIFVLLNFFYFYDYFDYFIFTNLKRANFKKGEVFKHFDRNSNLIFASIHQCRL